MSITTRNRSIVGLTCLVAFLALPAIAAAQSSTFIIPFNRVGTPGSECRQAVDANGNPLFNADGTAVIVCTAVGAFVNPCTAENVDVTGSTTLTITTNVTGTGSMKLSVGEVTKGTGMGWNALQAYLPGVNPDPLVANTYAFSESQQFNTQFTLNGDPLSLTSSTFSDKLFMKGAKSLDNWTIKATFTVKVNGKGIVTSVTSNLTGDICKG